MFLKPESLDLIRENGVETRNLNPIKGRRKVGQFLEDVEE